MTTENPADWARDLLKDRDPWELMLAVMATNRELSERAVRLGTEVQFVRMRLRVAEAQVAAVRELVDQDGADRYYVDQWRAHAIPVADLRQALGPRPWGR